MTSERHPNRPTPEDARENLSAYSIGAADPQESAQVQRLLESEPELRREAAEYAAAASLLAASVPRVEPPPALKDKILAAARASRPAAADLNVLRTRKSRAVRPGRGRMVWLAVAAAALLFALNVFWIIQLSEMRRSQTELDHAVALLTAMDAKRLELMDDEGEMRAMVVWKPTQPEGLIVAHALPLLTGDQVYQLWVIGEEGPTSAGMFYTDPEGEASMMFHTPRPWGSIVAMAISVEPPGGSEQPTTEPLALGEM